MPVRPPCGHRCSVEIGLAGYSWGADGDGTTFFDTWRGFPINYLLFDFGRHFTECGVPNCNWDVAEAFGNAAVAAGFTVVARVGGRTDNEESNPELNPWDDDWLDGWNVDALASITTALERLPDVRHWQIENEPQWHFFGDLPNYYPYTATNWARYHELLKREAALIRAANSANIIISPGLPGTDYNTFVRLRGQVEWLERYVGLAYDNSEDLPFDILAVHLWTFAKGTNFHNRWRHPYRGIGHRIRELHSIITDYGYDVDEIWITEGAKEIERANGGYTEDWSPTDQQNFFIDAVAETRQEEIATKYFWWGWKGDYATNGYYLIFNDTGPNPVYQTFIDYCAKYNQRT